MSRRTSLTVILSALAACSSPAGLPNPGSPSPHVVFLVQNAPPESAMTALYDGAIVLDQAGCLRRESNDGATVIWPVGFSLVGRGDELSIQDATGQEVARVGGRVRLGGGLVPALNAGAPISTDNRHRASTSCPGTYWFVSEVLPRFKK